MLSGEEGAVATLPVPDGAEVDLMFDTMGVFGKAGDKLLLNEGLRSQAKFRPGESNYKYYVKEKIKEGKCAFFNPKLGKHILIKYDADKLPYLGIWVNDGGFKDMYNFAFEPATLPYDNTPNAAERGLEFSIAPHESYEFKIKIDIE